MYIALAMLAAPAAADDTDLAKIRPTGVSAFHADLVALACLTELTMRAAALPGQAEATLTRHASM